MDDRDEFARRQAAMTATWYEGVTKRYGDVEKYIHSRHIAYLDRWKEAARFIKYKDRVLDVGGGNLYPILLEYLKNQSIEYHYIDIDPSAVNSSRNLAYSYGFCPDHFNNGFNDKFVYADEHFDCVFSSHCIEHSIDLPSTFRELNRIIKEGGYLLMAVPFGWEENPEHPYFFNPEQWIALVEDAGFEIRIAQVGREYPEAGFDFFIAARKLSSELHIPRINAHDFKKKNYSFFSFSHPSVHYTGNVTLSNEQNSLHCRGTEWKINVSFDRKVSKFVPIFLHHDWSGKVFLSNDVGYSSFYDLFSWFHFIGVVGLENEDQSTFDRAAIEGVGKNAASRSTEAVFYGYMCR